MLKSKNLIQTAERFIELNPRSVVYVNMYLCGKAATKRFYNEVNAQAQRVRISNTPTPCKSERLSPNHIKSTQIFMVCVTNQTSPPDCTLFHAIQMLITRNVNDSVFQNDHLLELAEIFQI